MRQILLLLLVLMQVRGITQQALPVTDSIPAMLDGLKAGYDITDASEKEVGKKGNFSRYKLRFYVTNTANEAKIMYQKPSFFGGGQASNIVVRFMCANATGARFTNKQATMQMQPATIMADVEDKDCATGKIVINHRTVNIGYWLKPGESITLNTIMITPLGEKPAVTAVYYPETGTQGGALLVPGPGQMPQQQGGEFVHIKNLGSNNYLQIESGPLTCTAIDREWWSAQWEILPVPGTSYFVIRNRWKANFVAIDNAGNVFMAPTAQTANAMWLVEDNGQGAYTIRSAANNAKLIVQNNLLRVTASFTAAATDQWIIEP